MLRYSKTLAFCLLAVMPPALASDWVPDQVMLRAGSDVQAYTSYSVYPIGKVPIASNGRHAEGTLGWKLSSPEFGINLFVKRSEPVYEFVDVTDHVKFTRVGVALSGEVLATETMSLAISTGLAQLRWDKLDLGRSLSDPHGCLEFDECAPPTPATVIEPAVNVTVLGRYSPTKWAGIFAGVGRQEISFEGTTYEVGITIQVYHNLFIELRRFDEIVTKGNTAGLIFRF